MKAFAVLVTAALALASPIEKRQVGGILICTGANATGACSHAVYPLDACVNVTAPFRGHANTFAPDGEAFACYPYALPCGAVCRSPEGCTLGAIDFSFAHKYNMSAVQGSSVAAFSCFRKG